MRRWLQQKLSDLFSGQDEDLPPNHVVFDSGNGRPAVLITAPRLRSGAWVGMHEERKTIILNGHDVPQTQDLMAAYFEVECSEKSLEAVADEINQLVRRRREEEEKKAESERYERDKVLAPVAAQLRAAERLAVAMTICPGDDEIPCGQSKVGGTPDVPDGFVWPQHGGSPLDFLAQVNLAEIAAAGPLAELPAAGWLLFFYCEEADGDARKVLLIPPEAGPLHRSVAPAGVQTQYQPGALRLKAEPSLPSSYSDFSEESGFDEDQMSAFFDLTNSMGSGDIRLLGYPMEIQGPMESECELLARGIPYSYDAANDPAIKEAARSWRLLLQLTSDDDTGFHWGDDGMTYFFIREADLRALNFDAVCAVMQCG